MESTENTESTGINRVIWECERCHSRFAEQVVELEDRLERQTELTYHFKEVATAAVTLLRRMQQTVAYSVHAEEIDEVLAKVR